MCVIYLAFEAHPEHPLIVLANRDEFYDRPSQAAHYWADEPNIFAGRDLVGGGTWLGVTRTGRFAAVTNYRDPTAPLGTRSRGELVSGFLRSRQTAAEYLESVRSFPGEFSGFNLLVGQISSDVREICYFSNRGGSVETLKPGVYGLSNHLLDTPWPKVAKGKSRFAYLLESGTIPAESCFEILSDEELAEDAYLPATGVSYAIEKAISAIFIKTTGYGTRCSTVLTFDNSFTWDLKERVFV